MVKQVKKIGDYLLLKTIGKGTFGKYVYHDSAVKSCVLLS